MLLPTRMKNTIGLCVITTLLLMFSSCKDETQIRLTQQNIARLAQQNQFVKSRIVGLRGAIDQQMEKRDSIDWYLKKSIADFNKNTDSLLNKIAKTKKEGSRAEIENLFTNYVVFLNSYRKLEKDADINWPRPAVDIDSFLNLDKKRFNLTYINSSDSLMIQNQLLILESDVLVNQNKLLEEVYMKLYDDRGCIFDDPMAIAIPEKGVYKKGEKLEVHALLVKYDRQFKGDAIIDGQKMLPKDGIFEYSRLITERPGTYNVPIEISWQDQYGEKRTYPARVTIKVE
jgi:hypothetical protein